MQVASRIAAWQSGKKLPYDAEVEWLENANDQSAIFLGFNLTPTMCIDVSFVIRQQPTYTNWNAVGGQAWSQSFINVGGDASNGGRNLNASVYSYFIGSVAFTPENTPEKRFRVIINTQTGIAINGESVYDGSFVNTKSSRVPAMMIFGQGGENGAVWSNAKTGLRICDCRVFEPIEGDLIDLIAVRKNGVGMFYDKVSGNFFGADKGFIIGPDKLSNVWGGV